MIILVFPVFIFTQQKNCPRHIFCQPARRRKKRCGGIVDWQQHSK